MQIIPTLNPNLQDCLASFSIYSLAKRLKKYYQKTLRDLITKTYVFEVFIIFSIVQEEHFDYIH
jgi:hypothetical protein